MADETSVDDYGLLTWLGVVPPEQQPYTAFQGDAEAILATSENADQGIADLVEAYKSTKWDDEAAALETVREYADKLREKTPGAANLLSAQETIEVAPVKPADVDYYLEQYEQKNLAAIKESKDPVVAAYDNLIEDSISNVVTAEFQRANNEDVSQFTDKITRTALGAIPGVIKELGMEDAFQRNLRADSNDTLASAVSSGVGSILQLPVLVPNMLINIESFGREQYNESKKAGAPTSKALDAAAIEGTNQALDSILDKMILGKALPAGKRTIGGVLKRGLAEGSQEFVQNKISDVADVVGLSKDELDDFFSDQALLEAAAGGIIGGAATFIPGQAQPFGPEVSGDALVNKLYPETQPVQSVAVVGEPVNGGTNITTVDDASTGAIGETLVEPVATTDADEMFIENVDGTLSRVVSGERKQAHTGAMIVSEETANRIATIQAVEPNGIPIVIRKDDLNRPYIDHPNVGPDLTIDETIENPDPVMIPEDTSGHVLQYSDKPNELGSIEHSATLSKAPIKGVSTVGAQAVKESSIADKLRERGTLNPQVEALLGLDEDFAFGLTYPPSTNDNNQRLVNDEFAKYDNNYVAFANALLAKDYADITPTESVAAAWAGTAFSRRGNEVRSENPVLAEQYDILSANLTAASQKIRSGMGQALQMQTLIPITGESLIAAAKFEAGEVAKAKAAQEAGVSVKDVDNAVKENQQLDRLSEGLNEQEVNIQQAEKAAEERHDAPEKAVIELEKQVSDIDSKPSEGVRVAEEQVSEAEKAVKESETQAAALEKEADNIETTQEQASEKVDELNKKVEELSRQEPDTAKVDQLKSQKEALPKPTDSPTVKSAQAKVKAAKDIAEKRRARLEFEQVLNEEKARGIKERAAIEEQIRKAEEEQAAEKARIKEETAKAKEELALAKKEAKENKRAEALAKRKQANELRAENKKLRAEKDAALREAKKQQAAERAELKKQKKEQLAQAKEERNATRQLRKEQLALEKQKLAEQKKSLQENRSKLDERKKRNEQLTATVNKYKEEFQKKLTPEQIKRIGDLTEVVKTQTGLPKQDALKELGKTLAGIKGIELVPGSDPWSTFWQANVLSSIGTNLANITGNFVAPVKQVVSDLSTGEPGKAYKFIRGWAGAVFSKPSQINLLRPQTILSERTRADIVAGLSGELPSRQTEELADKDLSELASGTGVFFESDPVKSLQTFFGTGKLGKFLSSPAYTLRTLGAMDAVFSRASREGRIAREAPSYDQYLAAKASDYNTYVVQAKTEKAKLDSLGVRTAENYVNMRADELSFAARSEQQRERITKAAQRDVFQEQGGPRGAVGRLTGGILNAVSGRIPFTTYKNLNTKWTVASAIGFSNAVVKDNVSVDKVYPIVARGVAQGKTLVINGQEVKGGSTKQLLGSLLEAVTNKQVISLRGDSIRPFKYVSGMFVNTASQILDMSVEALPGIGYFDKRIGGKWREFTTEEKAQLYGNQVASTLFVGAILARLLPDMDDEENASLYVYGGMRDAQLRESYKAKGIKPFSFRVGKTTVSYKDIPGINLILGGIGELADAHMVAKRTPDRPLTVGSSFQAAGIGAMYTASQISLLKNVSTLADFISLEDNQYDRQALDIVSNISAGFVPFAGAGRELERFVYGDLAKTKNTTNRMLQNIPFSKFFSENKPALNMFGEPLRAHVLPGINRFIGEAKQSPELDWVLRNGYKISLLKTGQKLTSKQLAQYSELLESDDPDNFEAVLTEEDQYRYQELYGPELKAILAEKAGQYPHGYDPAVQKQLDKQIKATKARIKKQILTD